MTTLICPKCKKAQKLQLVTTTLCFHDIHLHDEKVGDYFSYDIAEVDSCEPENLEYLFCPACNFKMTASEKRDIIQDCIETYPECKKEMV